MEKMKKMRSWTFWLALGMMGVSCASPSPKPKEPPPHFREPVPASKQVTDAPGESALARQEALPAPVERVPAVPEASATPSIKVEPRPKEAFYVHTVRYSGETISIIATWYTGNAENWKALTQANPQIDPHLIFEGNEILIPEKLLKTREAMPKKFVNRFYSKSMKERVRPKSQPAQSQKEEIKFFGPQKK